MRPWILLTALLASCASPAASPPTMPQGAQDMELMLMSEHLGPVPAGAERTLVFHVMTDGEALTSFDRIHEELLHLIVVRTDMQHFQHLHPAIDASGTFTMPLTLPAVGTYALYADFQPRGGAPTVLREMLTAEAPSDAAIPDTDDDPQRAGAYEIEPTTRSPLPAGISLQLGYRITKQGAPVEDLQNYLGAKGHAVVLRAETLEFLHTHPADSSGGHGEETPLGPGEVAFGATIPAPGVYAVFAQFRPEGELVTVRTVYEVIPPPEDASLEDPHAGHDIRELRVEAFQFDYAPEELRVQEGEHVRLLLTTRDVPHSFTLEGYDLSVNVFPGKEAVLEFMALQPGRFRYGCDVACGSGHGRMATDGGVLIVEPLTEG